jgi:hypothetical protein
MTNPSAAKLRGYGPVQFPGRLGIPVWQFERARRAGLIPPPDPATGRWPASVFTAVLADLDQVRSVTGSQPDVGAVRAAAILAGRFRITVTPDVLLELDRTGLIRQVADYKGNPVYDGRALEAFSDLYALQRAIATGRLLKRNEPAGYLKVRLSDVGHLVRSGWLEPVTWVRGSWQRRRDYPNVPLFRTADLEVLLAHPGIDWDAVRATPAGRPSQLAALTLRTGERGA